MRVWTCIPLVVLAALAAPAEAQKVGGSGRLQPAGGLIQISGPGGRQVERVLAKEGDRVRKGDVLFTIADQATRVIERGLAEERMKAAEDQAVSRVRLAELELEAARLTARHAAADLQAIAGLDDTLSAASERRRRSQALADADAAARVAAARLENVRKATEAERRSARKNLDLARAQVSQTAVSAPIDGTVLEVSVRPGMTLGQGPAVALGDISVMQVVGDFFEGDLPKIRPGMRARATSAALGTTLTGVVERVGRVVDPVNRLAKVVIRLDSPSPADRFIGMQVDVTVEAGEQAKK
ncbi:MAG: efflux RND transporter periplasmic adaptor subunit [Pseudomonadota bacterium]